MRRAVHVGARLELNWWIDAITPKDSLKGYLLDRVGTLSGPEGVAVEATCRGVALWPDGLAG